MKIFVLLLPFLVVGCTDAGQPETGGASYTAESSPEITSEPSTNETAQYSAPLEIYNRSVAFGWQGGPTGSFDAPAETLFVNLALIGTSSNPCDASAIIDAANPEPGRAAEFVLTDSAGNQTVVELVNFFCGGGRVELFRREAQIEAGFGSYSFAFRGQGTAMDIRVIAVAQQEPTPKP